MKTLINYIERNWGVVQVCAHCDSSAMALCGNCMEYAYCGTQCQTQHWEGHRLECIGGGAGEKRAREEEELDPPGMQEINLSDLTGDIWLYISKFLSTKDLKNLNATQRIIQQRLRRMFFARFRFRVKTDDAYFKEIQSLITAVTVDSFAGLKAISFKRNNNITDVKVVPPFEVRTNAKLVWPPQITHLNLRESKYVGPLDDLPEGLKALLLPHGYDRPLNYLPRKLEVIIMFQGYDDYYWNHNIDLFPMDMLQELRMGYYFNQSISILSKAKHLKRLHLWGKFNQPVDYLSECTNLKILELGDQFDLPIDKLPESLEELTLGREFWQDFPPLPNLKKLVYNARNPLEYDNLPRNLKILNMLFVQTTVPLHDLPPTLEELVLPYDFEQRGNVFPDTLKRLRAPRHAKYLLAELPPDVTVVWY